MKKDLHPQYHTTSVTKCACGAEFQAGSTQEKLSVELCSKCHPFFTGKQKLVDTARRVDKFKQKLEKQASVAKARKGKKAKQAARTAKKTEEK